MSEDSAILDRITELNDKATQLLTALSFAIAAAVLLKNTGLTHCETVALRWGLRLWVLAIFPVLGIVAPIKEFARYDGIRALKVFLLWVAVVLIAGGAIAFLCSIW